MADIDIRVQGRAGRITLNRPQALNALTLPMVQAIRAALSEWANDPAVALVIVDGAGGRALCAGGDIRVLYETARTGDISVPHAFFSAEYAMNGEIARFPKPYVALMDGVVMGGGVGLSAHGSVRVVTERTLLAMPETGIGLFPDVGATWLLSRDLPRGLHLALTGAKVSATIAMQMGLADHFILSDQLAPFADALCKCTDAASVQECVGRYGSLPPSVLSLTEGIEHCFEKATMEQIVAALEADLSPAAQAASNEIRGKSPSSLKVTLRALHEASRMRNLDEALAQELVLAMACMRSHDFVEGVRAAVIDKDRTPAWRPSTLAAVTDEAVAQYFA